jgi:hypothetical protein
MPASERDPVKPSHPRQPVLRTHVKQSPLHVAANKTNTTTTGRDAVRQSPPPQVIGSIQRGSRR